MALRPPGPIAPKLRIGLLGGSFNPAHDGHRHITLAAMRALGLDYVWWLVSPGNPLKPTTGMAPLPERLISARRAAQHPRIIATDIETTLGTRYTADTIAALKRRFPQTRFVWLMGSDNLVQFPRWKHWDRIFAQVPIAVAARPGSLLTALAAKPAIRFAAARKPAGRDFAKATLPAWTLVPAQYHPASSTAIRAGKA